MKRFKLMFMSLAVASAFSLSSCKDDDKSNPKPTVSFKTGAGYTYQNETKATGAPIKIGIIATGTANLKSVKLILVGGGTIFDTTISSKQFNRDIDHVLSGTTGNETYTAQVTDDNGETAEVSLTITKVQNEVIEERTVTMAGQDNSNPTNFWSATTNDFYTLADAKNNSANVDWVYFFGSTNKATISSPDNLTDLNQIYSSNPDKPANWGTRNSTRFRLTNMSVADFNAIMTGAGSTNTPVITEYGKAPVTALKANNLTVGQVWVFETRTNKPAETIKGLLKVTGVPSDALGNVEVIVKMETN